jgi:hypothetical protein
VRRFLLIVLALFVAAPASAALATTYYVSPTGSDAAAGTLEAPWQTVSRVDRAQLAPGDVVLFEGGATFSDATLMPPSSGTSAAPITFGSYGQGLARIANEDGAVWIPAGTHDLVFNGLDLTSSNAIVFSSAATGVGVSGIVLQYSLVHDSPFAGLTNQPQDSAWNVLANTFRHLGDSGLIVQADGMTIDGNTIVDTGWNPALDYGKHGIYAKAPNLTVSNNDISQDKNGSAVSLRFGGARVFGNAIHDTSYAVSLFPQDPANTGTAEIRQNRMWGITGFAFYYAGQHTDGRPSGIDVTWASNTARLQGAEEAVNVSELTAPRVWVANSVFTGTYGSAYRGCASCREFANDWFGGRFNMPNGTGDLHLAPALSSAPALAPTAGSPLIDAGALAVGGAAYAPGCDGFVWHFCGVAPDVGAVEYQGERATQAHVHKVRAPQAHRHRTQPVRSGQVRRRALRT